MARKRELEESALDMTPMIDCVFQLMIFFIVTINVSEMKDEDVRLELAPSGPEIESGTESDVSALVIDVNRRGRISLNNATLTTQQLRGIVRGRRNRQGNTFQVWIRGDTRAHHVMIRRVMDVCTDEGIGKVSFVAVKDPRTPAQKEFFARRRRSR
ncbi:MAG: biopolymer transporter ExbD [Lentisphaerae bacterium]|jgi:biopolymer transport protein ExbD|nr:biopolymer transporter ExbD [Lentisphaerota bacterium]